MYWGPIFTEEIIKPVQLQEEITSLGMKKFVIKWHANDLKEVIYHFAVTKKRVLFIITQSWFDYELFS